MSKRQLSQFLIVASSLLAATLPAHAEIGPIPMSLKGVPVPAVPGLFDGPAPIVLNRQAALVLGKALFWDSRVGSDGVACATCHFHAGADGRVRNQLAPAGRHGGARSFEPGSDGLPRGANQWLRAADFPLTQSQQPLEPTDIAGLARLSDDVVGSAGSFGGSFLAVDPLVEAQDDCSRTADPTFQVAGTGTRRVIERNAPSVINAVFNHRVLWDGRASNVFNGSSADGHRDARAGVWVLQADGTLKKERLALINSALASQAMTAPLSDIEMGCRGRSLADVGRKLLNRVPLEDQLVHAQDSVLGALSYSARSGSPAPGLTLDYNTLIKQAFHPRFWSSRLRAFGRPAVPARGVMAPGYTQTEANFSLFFGLALQIYQSTLIADDSPFDRSARDAQDLPSQLTPAQQRGLQQFRTAHCALCHIGPTFSAAAIDTNAALVALRPTAFGGAGFRNTTSRNVVGRTGGRKGFAWLDTGFAITGVGQDGWDKGLAGLDEAGQAGSLAAQYVQHLAGNSAAVAEPRVAEVRACDLANPAALPLATANYRNAFTLADGIQPQPQAGTGCLNPAFAWLPTPAAAVAELAKPGQPRLQLLTDGAFKIPMLRNIELTGPYMHNGSMATLEQVVEFYARGGNFNGASKQTRLVFAQPQLQLDAQARADLLEFLKSLTDERVRYERAPFDHPALAVPNGHRGDRSRITAAHPLGADLGQDDWLQVPAVGALGRSTPLPPVHTLMQP